MKAMLPLLFLGFFPCYLWSAEETYYQLDFSGEPYTPYEPIKVDDSDRTPSSIPFGQLEVIDDLDGKLDQALFFNTTGNKPHFFYDQISFEVGKNQPTYHVGFDVVIKGLIGSTNHFTVLMKLPYVSNVIFQNNGKIRPNAPIDNRPDQFDVPYQEGVPIRVDISIDLPKKRRVVLIDGKEVYDGPIHQYASPRKEKPKNPKELDSVRFSLGTTNARLEPDHATRVAVDNIVIDNGFVTEK